MTHGQKVTQELTEMAKVAMVKGLTPTTKTVIRSLYMDNPDALCRVPEAEKTFIYHNVMWA